jgi:hypothetical protein
MLKLRALPEAGLQGRTGFQPVCMSFHLSCATKYLMQLELAGLFGFNLFSNDRQDACPTLGVEVRGRRRERAQGRF